MKKLKTFFPIICVLVAFAFLVPRPAHAFVVGWIVYGIAWFISAIAGIAISIEAWVLGFLLEINMGIVNSPPVQFGFPVTLSVANLGFVLAIVVIAIATILRYESYGIKQTLWKLIVMAIVVNFGLIIAGTVLNFTDQLSLYFLNEINPVGSVGTASSSASSFVNFGSAVAGAFQPQKFAILSPTSTNAGATSGMLRTVVDFLTSDIAGVIGTQVLQPVASLVFSIFFLIFIIIVLGVLIVMLIIRYVYIGYLLVLLPLAWAAWIFPATKQHWNKWWNSFLKQAFFAPIVIFFLWVALQTSYEMSRSGSDFFKVIDSYKSPNSNIIWKGLDQIFTSIFSPVITQFLQLSVLLGIMLGGIFAAQAMSIKFADVAQKTAIGGTKGFGGWAATKGAGFAARAGAGAATRQGPVQYQSGWRRALNPLNKLTYQLGTPLRAAAQRTQAGQAALRTVQAFGAKAATSPGVVASVWTGMVKGSGLFKKKGTKAKGRTASGEEVEIEIEDEGGGGGAAPEAPRGPRGGVPPIIIPPGVTGPGRAEARRVVDEETGDLVTPEEIEQRREARERAESERRRAQTPPTTPA